MLETMKENVQKCDDGAQSHGVSLTDGAWQQHVRHGWYERRQRGVVSRDHERRRRYGRAGCQQCRSRTCRGSVLRIILIFMQIYSAFLEKYYSHLIR